MFMSRPKRPEMGGQVCPKLRELVPCLVRVSVWRNTPSTHGVTHAHTHTHS
nr:uncharacterized protein CTRU02_14510 [Colletotrichum truncatum]KAF6782066.1 hypothetical protein CTRU02_14510 [Colletotrichum truncatum]